MCVEAQGARQPGGDLHSLVSTALTHTHTHRISPHRTSKERVNLELIKPRKKGTNSATIELTVTERTFRVSRPLLRTVDARQTHAAWQVSAPLVPFPTTRDSPSEAEGEEKNSQTALKPISWSQTGTPSWPGYSRGVKPSVHAFSFRRKRSLSVFVLS